MIKFKNNLLIKNIIILLVSGAIAKVLGNVTFVDGSHGIKNRVYDLIKDKLNKKGGKINIISTKDDVSKIILDIVKGNK